MRAMAAALLLLLAGCSETPTVQGAVHDVLGKPIAGATVLSDRDYARVSTNAQGRYALEVDERGPIRLMAGAPGYIRDVVEIEIPSDEDLPIPAADFRLWAMPEAYGFFGRGHGEVVHLQAARVVAMGSGMREIHGVRDLTRNRLPASRAPHELLFHSSRSDAELRQLEIKLLRLRFLESTTLPGPLGDQEVATAFWVPDSEVPFTLRGLQADNVFLVTTDAPLEAGSYAFEFQRVLRDAEPGSLDRFPSEMRVVYPFEVK